MIGASGARQRLMIEAALLAGIRYPYTPMIMAGDMNINQVADLPAPIANLCHQNPFLHPAIGCDPYEPLKMAGFISSQYFASLQNKMFRTVWNSACVDYLGSRGVKSSCIGTIPPIYKGLVYSDHAFPCAAFRL